MSEQNWNFENDQEFEKFLTESLSEMPPNDIVQDVTPWKKATNRILTGMALCSVTLNFLWLDYIFPTIGMILILLGFRTLRRENKWFHRGWSLICIRMIFFLAMLILNAAVIRSTSYGKTAHFILLWVNTILLLFMCFTLWRGFRAVQKKVNIQPRANGAVALIFWYTFVCVLAFIPYVGWITALALVLAYILIIRSLLKMSKELDEAGYAVQTSEVQMSDEALARKILLILVLGIGCGYLFYNKYPMKWESISEQAHAEEKEQAEKLETTKTHLIQLGFPEEILEDLKAEDILACQDALRLVVSVHEHPMNEGREEMTMEGSTKVFQTVYDVKELQITGIGVEIAGEREEWRIFHHFQWTTNPGFCGTESLQMWPTTRLEEGWVESTKMTGQVLYDDDGQTYVSEYQSLETESYTSNNILFGEQTNLDIFATFSFPNEGENHRGYVTYAVKEVADGCIIDSWINYTHQTHPFQYPVLTAKEKRMQGGWNEDGAFRTVQDALQFYPNDEELKTFE